jgi:hypothetical protein
MERMAVTVHQDHKVYRASPGNLVPREIQALPVPPVPKEPKVRKGSWVRAVLLAFRGQRVLPDRQDPPVGKDQPGRRANQDPPVRQVRQEPPARWARVDLLDLLGPQDPQDPLDPPDQRAQSS